MHQQAVNKKICISYRNLNKATPIVKLVTKSCSQIYDLPEDSLFNYYPLLMWIETLVYEADEQVEAAQAQGRALSQVSPWNFQKEIIESLFKELNLEHPTIQKALNRVSEFFDLESQLLAAGATVTHFDVIRAGELRPCDFQLLHCTLIQLAGKSYRAEVFDLLSCREILLEFVDDVLSYKKDIAVGQYNTYWMFERLYGEEAADYLQAEAERYRHLFQERLKQFSTDEQKFYSELWSRFEQRNALIFNADLIRASALKGEEVNELNAIALADQVH